MNHVPFTYLIGWSTHNKFYYGMRTARNCHPRELWKTYFTSSKEVKRLRKSLGEPDVIEIRKTFVSFQECSAWEAKVLRRLGASFNDKFLNRHNGGEKFNTTGLPQTDAYYKARCKKYAVMSPDGEVIYVIGLKAFCRDVGLFDSGMIAAAKGEVKSATGWQCRYYDDPTPFYRPEDVLRSFKSGYRVLSPSGEEYQTDNMTRFCANHKLNTGMMISAARGEAVSHRGWQCKYATDNSPYIDKEKLVVLYRGKYLLTDPFGNQTVVSDLSRFCKENNLRKNHIHSVCNGQLTNHKQWRAQHV